MEPESELQGLETGGTFGQVWNEYEGSWFTTMNLFILRNTVPINVLGGDGEPWQKWRWYLI